MKFDQFFLVVFLLNRVHTEKQTKVEKKSCEKIFIQKTRFSCLQLWAPINLKKVFKKNFFSWFPTKFYVLFRK